MIVMYIFLVGGLRMSDSSHRPPPAYTVQEEVETGMCFIREESVKYACPVYEKETFFK